MPAPTQTRYGMVTDIRNMPSLASLQAAGIVPLFGGNDPGGFAAVQRAMATAQGNAGLWIPSDQRSAQDYVNWVKQWLGAVPNPRHIDLNIETAGKGYPGSPQWNYTDQVLQQLMPYLQGKSWSVSPMGKQDDFNYGAVVSRGGMIWPQAYGGDASPWDVGEVMEWVKRNNVPLDRIVPILGNASQQGFGHLYGIDLPGFRDPSGSLRSLLPGPDWWGNSPGLSMLAKTPGGSAGMQSAGALPAPHRVNQPSPAMPVASDKQVQDYVARLRQEFGV